MSRTIWRSIVRLAAAGLLLASAPGGPAQAAPAAGRRAPLLVGFYDGWDPKARIGLRTRLAALDVFAPRWITVRGAAAEVVVEPDQGVPALIASLPHPPRVFPTVSNAHDDIWDAPAAQAVILDPAARARFVAKLAELARANGYGGYVLDFETLSPQAAAAYPALLAALKAALAPAGQEAWVTATVAPDQPLGAFAAAGDAVVLMAYDECWANSTPGPIAGEDWIAAMLRQRLAGLDAHRVVVALASYGYDWPSGSAASALSVGRSRALAAAHGAKIARDPASGNLSFAYTPPGRTPHEVWFVDSEAFRTQSRAAAALGVRGVALWRIGLEDPAIWRTSLFSARAAAEPSAAAPLPHPCNPLPVR